MARSNHDEQLIARILALHDEGKSVAEIRALIPDGGVVLEETLAVLAGITSFKAAIAPSQELLSAVIAKLPDGVNAPSKSDISTVAQADLTPASAAQPSTLHQLQNFLRPLSRAFVPIGIAAVLVVIFTLRSKPHELTAPTSSPVSEPSQVADATVPVPEEAAPVAAQPPVKSLAAQPRSAGDQRSIPDAAPTTTPTAPPASNSFDNEIAAILREAQAADSGDDEFSVAIAALEGSGDESSFTQPYDSNDL